MQRIAYTAYLGSRCQVNFKAIITFDREFDSFKARLK